MCSTQVVNLHYFAATKATADECLMLMVLKSEADAAAYSASLRNEFIEDMKACVDLTGPAKGAQFMVEVPIHAVLWTPVDTIQPKYAKQ